MTQKPPPATSKGSKSYCSETASMQFCMKVLIVNSQKGSLRPPFCSLRTLLLFCLSSILCTNFAGLWGYALDPNFDFDFYDFFYFFKFEIHMGFGKKGLTSLISQSCPKIFLSHSQKMISRNLRDVPYQVMCSGSLLSNII